MHGIPSPERPPTSGASADQQPIQYNILDITDSVTREYYHDAAGDHKNTRHAGAGPVAAKSSQLRGDAASSSRHVNPQSGGPASAMAHRDGDLQRAPHPAPSEIRLSGACFPGSATSTSPSRQAEHAASNLLALGQTSPFAPSTIGSEGSADVSNYPLLPRTSAADMPDANTEMRDAPDGDVFRPGSTYLNLHSTLRHHIVQESRSTGPSRADTPCDDYDDDDTAEGPGSEEGADFSLTEEQEWVLWVNWLDEVAPGVRGPANCP